VRVECKSIQDFIESIEGHEKATSGKLLYNILYISEFRNPLNGDSPRSATSFEVIFQTSCVFVNADDSEILIVAGENCGIDRETSDGDFAGTTKKDQLLLLLEQFAEQRGVSIIPGIASPS